jgi:Zn-dependent M28 family amino/carboxypeptidase
MALVAACGDAAPAATAPNPSGGGVLPTLARVRGEPLKPPHEVITAELLREHTRALSDDAMQGRRPGTQGGRRAVEYIVTAMEDLGLEPAGTRGYRQSVPMRAIVSEIEGGQLALTGGKAQPRAWALGTDFVGGTVAHGSAHAIDAPLVFVGYGVTSPEYDWDDYAGIDVRGKIVVALVGDPPVADERFAGDALTYYGRWSYKFERALQAGAIGCLVVHDEEAASYGWNVVQSSWSGEFLVTAEGEAEALLLQGWISSEAADELAQRSGASLPAWQEQALRPRFRAVRLPARVSGTIVNTERELVDDNVIGRIPGTDLGAQAVVITAHWDHLGMAEGVPEDEDAIFNGAVDNASGLATMLAVAAGIRARARAGRPPRRSILFIATTAEEQGLLGSRWFVEHPTVPLSDIVGAINLDSMNVAGRTRAVEIAGAGRSSLEDVLADVLAPAGRHVVPDSRPGSGGYFRSDHFPFAQKGVPALYFHAAPDMEDGGVAEGERLLRARAARYHTVDDEFDEAWTFAGAEQDAEAVMNVALQVADADAAPTWRPTSEFAHLRTDASPK